jgi:hypothetical protein
MCEKYALIDLRSSVDELRETIAANRRLRAELRQLKSTALSSSCTELRSPNEAAKPGAPFDWWVCEEPEE